MRTRSSAETELSPNEDLNTVRSLLGIDWLISAEANYAEKDINITRRLSSPGWMVLNNGHGIKGMTGGWVVSGLWGSWREWLPSPSRHSERSFPSIISLQMKWYDVSTGTLTLLWTLERGLKNPTSCIPTLSLHASFRSLRMSTCFSFVQVCMAFFESIMPDL